MNYELAKELKDAGSPQRDRGTLLFSGGTNLAMSQKQMNARSAYAPTLEELVEACGKDFIALSASDDESGDWCAMGTGYYIGDIEGSTPTEAVARLWLALNKK